MNGSHDMGAIDGPFKPLPEADACSDLRALFARPSSIGAMGALPPAHAGGASTARLHGFDLHETPLLSGLTAFPGELMAARTTVALRRSMVGAEVLVLYMDGDPARPVVVGVLQEGAGVCDSGAPPAPGALDVQLDDERLTLSAEREIVLRCGDASITLTRAGKVVIKGKYIVSRSSGYNKIKGATVDIN